MPLSHTPFTAHVSWLKPNYPYYFFKTKDVPEKYLVDAFQSQKHHIYDIVVGDRRAEAAATLYHDDELDGLIQLEFSEMDAWFEEDEQIFVHPKDPYKVRHLWNHSVPIDAHNTHAARRRPAVIQARPHRGERRRGGKHDPSPSPIRDKPPDPVLHPEDGL